MEHPNCKSEKLTTVSSVLVSGIRIYFPTLDSVILHLSEQVLHKKYIPIDDWSFRNDQVVRTNKSEFSKSVLGGDLSGSKIVFREFRSIKILNITLKSFLQTIFGMSRIISVFF